MNQLLTSTHRWGNRWGAMTFVYWQCFYAATWSILWGSPGRFYRYWTHDWSGECVSKFINTLVQWCISYIHVSLKAICVLYHMWCDIVQVRTPFTAIAKPAICFWHEINNCIQNIKCIYIPTLVRYVICWEDVSGCTEVFSSFPIHYLYLTLNFLIIILKILL